MKKTGTPFRQTLIEYENNYRENKIKSFLESDFIDETNSGFSIDIIKLVNKLKNKEKNMLVKYLLNVIK